MLVNMTVKDFIYEVDSPSPAPGGGSVSALASSLGTALSGMVGHLTVNKKKFKKLDEETQKLFTLACEQLKKVEEDLIIYIDEDTKSFNSFMKAMALPKDSDVEILARKKAMEDATLEAIKVPFNIASSSLYALEQLDIILKHGNKNALSDIGVGTLLLHSGLEGAILNVKINLPGISDEAVVNDYKTKCKELQEKALEIKNNIISTVESKLS